jgi:predicted aminopeptidase
MAVVGLGVLLLQGCDTLSFYNQAVWGQVQLLHARRDVDRMLSDAATNQALRERLELGKTILAYAENEIGLAVEQRYSSYVELGRPFVVWNVFAAPPDAVEAEQWCFLIVGCVPYRGYFDQARAERAANDLERRGLETYVGGIPAYSTLGWFNDPLLSSFMGWPDVNIANLLFHELAHSRVWVEDDARFNENFANFVGMTATREWAQATGRQADHRRWRTQRADWVRFRRFALSAKSYLAEGFAAAHDMDARRAFKIRAMRVIADCYDENRADLGAGRYDALVETKLNNAYLVSLGTYEDLQGAFARLFADARHEWPRFFAEVERLAALPRDAREQRLDELGDQEVDERADDRDPGEVQCHAFANHGLNGDPPGGEHDDVRRGRDG